MRRFKDYVAVAGGLALVATVGAVLSSRQAIAEVTKLATVEIVRSVPLTTFAAPLAPAETFQKELFVTIADGTTGNLGSFDVPAGKRLVIEHVGGTIFLAGGAFVRVTHIRTDFGADFALVANKVSDQTDDVYLINAPMKLYADKNVEFSISRAPAFAGSALCLFSVSGYLVNN
jgi:hypothetical protein